MDLALSQAQSGRQLHGLKLTHSSSSSFTIIPTCISLLVFQVCYVTDCTNLYGRILVNHNIVSSVQGICKKKTEEIWIKLYPEEPYELDMSSCLSHGSAKNNYATSESTKYNLVSAVRRQIPFFYQVTEQRCHLKFVILSKFLLNNCDMYKQVSRSYMNNKLFLEGAVDRYKGFLHLIKRNRERSITRFCVPTYDIDLIWHSHQLHPASYCKDLVAIMGKVLEHDDTDSDRTKGQKLDVGFSETGKQWEETFGSRYWRAGAMYRGSAPSPLPTNLSQLQIQTGRKKVGQSDRNKNIIQLPKTTFVEVDSNVFISHIFSFRELQERHWLLSRVLFYHKLFPCQTFKVLPFLLPDSHSGYAGNRGGQRLTNRA